MTESQWNKEIVLECFRCLRDQDLDRMLMYMHAGMDLEVPGKRFGGKFKGSTEVRDFFENFHSIVAPQLNPNRSSETETILAEGNAVFVSTIERGTLTNGEAWETRLSWLFKFDGRKVLSLSFSFDTEAFEELLTEAGSGDGEAAA